MAAPILWELRIRRLSVQRRGERIRTVGTYQVRHAGGAPSGLGGFTVEAGGPGDNAVEGSGVRIEAGVYPLCVNVSASYRTVGFDPAADEASPLKPCLGVGGTGARTFILVHPGWGFSAAVGCIQPTGELSNGDEDIDYPDSRSRLLALLADLTACSGAPEPRHGALLPGARLVIEGEP